MPEIPEDVERVACLGWHVFPGSRYTRAAMFVGAQDQATCDLETIARWCFEWPGCNWRVRFGSSRLWGFDLDVISADHKHDGVKAFCDIAKTHDPLPPRPVLRSGGGGLAIFFAHHGEPIIGRTAYPAPGIDPRRGDQTQTLPPSVHPTTGLPYRWLTPPWEVSAPRAPGWLLDLVKPPPEPEWRPAPKLRDGDDKRNYAVGALRNAIGRVATAANGTRSDTLNRETYSVARFIRDGTLTTKEVRDSMLAAARANGQAGEDGIRAILMTIDSGLKARRR